MPLRDHFRPPLDDYTSWDGFYGGWPAVLVQHLTRFLPTGFVAEPRIRFGTYFDDNISTSESNPPPDAPWAPPRPTLTVETDLPEQGEYAVHVYDLRRGRRLVAAVEIVSPANKDRPEHRRAFVAKTAALLQQGVCVSIVDLATVRHFNLYAELLDLIGRTDPSLGTEPPHLYAATCRGRKTSRRALLDTWAYPLELGRPLPTLPLWLTEDTGLSLDLEASYEDTCRVLRLP